VNMMAHVLSPSRDHPAARLTQNFLDAPHLEPAFEGTGIVAVACGSMRQLWHSPRPFAGLHAQATRRCAGLVILMPARRTSFHLAGGAPPAAMPRGPDHRRHRLLVITTAPGPRRPDCSSRVPGMGAASRQGRTRSHAK